MAFMQKRASRITAHFLSALMALQLASPAWAQNYQVRVPANISTEALLPELTVTPAQIDFGEVAKASSAMANATLTNTGDRAADISFSSLALPFDFNHDCVSPLPSGQNCSLNFSFTPTEAGAHTGALAVSGGKLPVAIELVGSGGLPLAAIGVFNAVGAWSSSYSSVVAPTSTTLDFGNRTPGQVADRIVYLNNTGTNGSLKAAFEITGDIDQFRIVAIERRNQNNGTFSCGASVVSPGASTTTCTASDPSIDNYSRIAITLRHAPTRTGTASVSLRAIAGDNGSVVPQEMLTFTGSGI